jgi:hypothetical protein
VGNESVWPEHDKLRALEGKNVVVGDFIEWLKGQGVDLMVWHELEADEEDDATDDQRAAGGYYRHDGRSTQALIAAHFGIDEHRLDAEKKAMIEGLRRISAEVLGEKVHKHELHARLRGEATAETGTDFTGRPWPIEEEETGSVEESVRIAAESGRCYQCLEADADDEGDGLCAACRDGETSR